MEKLGIQNEQLISELRQEYLRLREQEAQQGEKTASADLRVRMEQIQARINELERQGDR